VVALGSGGVLVELLDDAVLRLPPLTHRQARAMIQASKSYRLLQGYRHYPPADVAALEQLLVDVAHLAAEDGRIAGLDLNPVIVRTVGQGIGIVDVRLAVGHEEKT
jgi:acyl-CoA synthetase (NDP forming)